MIRTFHRQKMLAQNVSPKSTTYFKNILIENFMTSRSNVWHDAMADRTALQDAHAPVPSTQSVTPSPILHPDGRGNPHTRFIVFCCGCMRCHFPIIQFQRYEFFIECPIVYWMSFTIYYFCCEIFLCFYNLNSLFSFFNAHFSCGYLNTTFDFTRVVDFTTIF